MRLKIEPHGLVIAAILFVAEFMLDGLLTALLAVFLYFPLCWLFRWLFDLFSADT